MTHDNAADLSTIVQLLDRARINSSHELGSETLIFEELGLDSLALMSLIEEIQRAFQLEFLPEDYTFENLSTVASVLKLVNHRREQGK